MEVFSPNDDPNDATLKEPKISCSKIVHRLINHCVATNRNAAIFMQDNPTKKLPKDYKEYPGKMDHTTCVALRVLPNTILQEQFEVDGSSQPSSGRGRLVDRKLSSSLTSNTFKKVSKPNQLPKDASFNSLEEARAVLLTPVKVKERKNRSRKKRKKPLSLETVPLVIDNPQHVDE